ncbi:MAG: hypothetical protein IJT60_06975 [Clostridia bacterium]|nr:hypothetical protein [Clostridia bacterium]
MSSHVIFRTSLRHLIFALILLILFSFVACTSTNDILELETTDEEKVLYIAPDEQHSQSDRYHFVSSADHNSVTLVSEAGSTEGWVKEFENYHEFSCIETSNGPVAILYRTRGGDVRIVSYDESGKEIADFVPTESDFSYESPKYFSVMDNGNLLLICNSRRVGEGTEILNRTITILDPECKALHRVTHAFKSNEWLFFGCLSGEPVCIKRGEDEESFEYAIVNPDASMTDFLPLNVSFPAGSDEIYVRDVIDYAGSILVAFNAFDRTNASTQLQIETYSENRIDAETYLDTIDATDAVRVFNSVTLVAVDKKTGNCRTIFSSKTLYGGSLWQDTDGKLCYDIVYPTSVTLTPGIDSYPYGGRGVVFRFRLDSSLKMPKKPTETNMYNYVFLN